MDNSNNSNANPNPTPPSPVATPTPDVNHTWPPALPANPLPTPTESGTTPSPNPIFGTPSFPENNSPAWPSMPSNSPTEPTIPSTFTPPTPSGDNLTSAPNLSPLDNPWSTPLQTPNINGSEQSAQPTWVPDSSASLADQAPSISPTPPTEPAPTDLSHLISNNPEGGLNVLNTAETLVVPSQTSGSAPEVPTVPTESHKNIPKWLIGVGVGLLVLVAGASGYFILGVGQNKQSTSVPAEISQTVKTPPPIAAPTAEPSAATGSANFGELQGSGAQQATSAADLLKQRQQTR